MLDVTRTRARASVSSCGHSSTVDIINHQAKKRTIMQRHADWGCWMEIFSAKIWGSNKLGSMFVQRGMLASVEGVEANSLIKHDAERHVVTRLSSAPP
jgi:hypothetical protein